jgi:hypothetical protein
MGHEMEEVEMGRRKQMLNSTFALDLNTWRTDNRVIRYAQPNRARASSKYMITYIQSNKQEWVLVMMMDC